MKNQTTLELQERRERNRRDDIPADLLALMDNALVTLNAIGLSKSALKVGDRAPAFTLNDAYGKPVQLETLLQLGPVVVSFYRGGWCPYCNIELRGLQRALPRIKELGASLVAISPELPDRSISTQERNKLEFSVLSDLGNKVARSFGLAFKLPEDLLELYKKFKHGLDDVNGEQGAKELPIPGTFVVDRTGVVRLAFVEEDYTKRLDPDAIIESLAML
jgi:peroxiredoxin